MCDCDTEPSTVWSCVTVRAAKEHVCSWCREPIVKGERHDRIGSLFDGSWSTFRLHAECSAAADRGDEWCCIGGDEHLTRGKTTAEAADARYVADGGV